MAQLSEQRNIYISTWRMTQWSAIHQFYFHGKQESCYQLLTWHHLGAKLNFGVETFKCRKQLLCFVTKWFLLWL